MELYLITGFLGAGKTTFLKKFVRWLYPKKIRLIVNEYGKEGVDGALLAELNLMMDEINNGSIFCVCRLDKFEQVLRDALMNPPDVLVVEASGLSDPTNIRKILAQQSEYGSVDYKGSICLVDAVNFEKVLNTARVCSRQLSVSELILINKADLVDHHQIDRVKALIHDRYPFASVNVTQQGDFNPSWIENMQSFDNELPQSVITKDITLQKAAITISSEMDKYKLEQFIKMFIEDTFRVKGFATLSDGNYLVNCTGTFIDISPWKGQMPANSNTIIALAGKGMSLKKAISKAREWYCSYIIKVE